MHEWWTKADITRQEGKQQLKVVPTRALSNPFDEVSIFTEEVYQCQAELCSLDIKGEEKKEDGGLTFQRQENPFLHKWDQKESTNAWLDRCS
jgi:hypothetical protein